jgi:predicted nucleic acid-binding protein
MFLLDTNVVSELRKVKAGKADANVARWDEQVDAGQLFVSVIVIEELETGVLRLERRDQAQGRLLRAWLEDHVLPAFSERILAVDLAVARVSARLQAPDPAPIRDTYIAATALAHGMTLVTRNTRDFEATGVPLLNPWLA